MTPAETALWDQYDAEQTVENRNALVLQYRQFAVGVAVKVARLMPAHATVDQGDLESEAIAGLITIIESGRYDRQRAAFTTWARLRLRGYLLDTLRDLDWVPRLERLREKRGDVEVTQMVPRSGELLEVPVHDPDTGDGLDTLRTVCRSLGTRERLIMILYYYERLTMKQIAATLKITESRVSQLHQTILTQIRARLVA